MNALVVLSALLAAASAQYLGYNGYNGYNGLYGAAGYSALPYNGYNGYATPYAGYNGYATPYAGYAGYAAPYAAGYAAPYNRATTYHSQDELGQASYGHATADQSHAAVRDAYGNVAGGYSYISPEGKPITVRYTAGVNGFQVESNALPVAPVDTGVAPVAPVYAGVAPAPVDFTPEVKAATAEHLAAHAEAKNRDKRSLYTPYSGFHGFAGYHGAGFRSIAAPAHFGYAAPAHFGYAAPAHVAYAAPAPVTYSAPAGYAAELTEVILNPGHATSYRVDPVA